MLCVGVVLRFYVFMFMPQRFARFVCYPFLPDEVVPLRSDKVRKREQCLFVPLTLVVAQTKGKYNL